MKTYVHNCKYFFLGMVFWATGLSALLNPSVGADSNVTTDNDSAALEHDASEISGNSNDLNAAEEGVLKDDLTQLALIPNPTQKQDISTIEDAVTVVFTDQKENDNLKNQLGQATTQINDDNSQITSMNTQNTQLQQQLNDANDFLNSPGGANEEAGNSGLSNLGLSFAVIVPVLCVAMIGSIIGMWWKRQKDIKTLQQLSSVGINDRINQFINVTNNITNVFNNKKFIDTLGKDMGPDDIDSLSSDEDYKTLLAIKDYCHENRASGLDANIVMELASRASIALTNLPQVKRVLSDTDLNNLTKIAQPISSSQMFTSDVDKTKQQSDNSVIKNIVDGILNPDSKYMKQADTRLSVLTQKVKDSASNQVASQAQRTTDAEKDIANEQQKADDQREQKSTSLPPPASSKSKVITRDISAKTEDSLRDTAVPDKPLRNKIKTPTRPHWYEG